MKKILDIILKLFGSNLSKAFCSACDAVKSFFAYKKTDIQNKIDEKNNKKEEEFCKKVDDVTNKGTLDDLLDLKRK